MQLRPVGFSQAHSIQQNERNARPYATLTGVNKPNATYTGDVWAVIGGKKVQLGTDAINSWVLGGGRYVAWSGPDGSGGFENEGESLRVYDTQTGLTKKVMSEYTMVDRVNSQRLSNGKTAFVVAMSDGGLGADQFAVVDPERGEVFHAGLAKRVGMQGDKLTVGYWHPEDYEDDTGKVHVPPYKTETLDMKEVLRRPVIVNPRDND